MQSAKLVVMGVCGCGKTTIGQILAHRLGVPFVEGDTLHPPENVDAMSRGIPLTDDMRAPWLATIADALGAATGDGCQLFSVETEIPRYLARCGFGIFCASHLGF